MSEAQGKGRPIVVGTDGTPQTRALVREAAELAVYDGVDLHVVGAYAQADDNAHRQRRVEAPRDVLHELTGRGDAWLDVEEARLMVASQHSDLVVHGHACRGSLAQAVRTVAEAVHGGIVLPERKRRRFARRRPALGQAEPMAETAR